MVKLTINGRQVEVEDGSTILQAAKKLGIFIPTFCHDEYDRFDDTDESCKVFGDCRICSCEVKGQDVLVTACSAKAENGMEVFTESEKVVNARKEILKSMVSIHPMDCVNCVKLGACKLQKYCEMYGIKDKEKETPHIVRNKDMSNRFYYQELEKCIRCGKCVKTCRQLVGVNALTMVKVGDIGYVLPNISDEVYKEKLGIRGDKEITAEMKLKAYNDGVVGMSDTGCVSCGNCVSVCPVGALMPKSENEFRDWETKKVVTTCTYCGVGCQIEYSVKDGKIVDAKPANGPSNQGLLCVKGKFAYDFVNHKDRLVHPMIRKGGKHSPLVQVSWEEALDFAANKIKEVRDTYGPDAIAGFSSARTINEDNYLFQKMLRAAIGTNNVDHCARL